MAPSIDGRLDDPAWTTATHVTRFVQTRPAEGEPASEGTDVYIAYDSERLYFGFHAHYSDPRLIRANRVDRDHAAGDDTITVYFDTFLDQQRAYAFSVNGYGVSGDSLIRIDLRAGDAGGAADGNAPPGDTSWDALFSTAGQLVDDGWTAEMAIPLKSLRYPARAVDEAHAWGFQIVRTIQSKGETVVWAPITRSVSGFMTQMGVLGGITRLSTSRNLEVQPTFTALQLGARGANGTYEADPHAEAGLNVKYGITSNLTADATFNPDFSQIESDQPQIEVNQRFPLRYNELRPFFLEGQDIFNLNQPGSVSLVHTRTIIDPRYGGKLTGKVGRTTVGVIVANDEAPGKRENRADPGFGQAAQFLVGRARYDLYAESYIGALFTDREFVNSHSRVAGLDSNFRLGGTNNIGFLAAWSDHLAEDGTALRGALYFVRFEHTGRHLNLYLSQKDTSPGFKTDAGFVQRVDTHQTITRGSYRWWPDSWIVNWGPSINHRFNFDYVGVLEDWQLASGLTFAFARNVTASVIANRDMERYRGTEFWKHSVDLSTNVRTSRRVTIGGAYSWGDGIRYIADPFLGPTRVAALNAAVQPFSRFRSEFTASTSRLVDPRTNRNAFDVRIYRSLTTFQFTDRMFFRNILQYNTFDTKLRANFLFTYRVNSGTAIYAGWDDHFEDLPQADEGRGVQASAIVRQRTNRAVFLKVQYLFRR